VAGLPLKDFFAKMDLKCFLTLVIFLAQNKVSEGNTNQVLPKICCFFAICCTSNIR
jgi:hypothetical protein